jgi:adenylate kinase
MPDGYRIVMMGPPGAGKGTQGTLLGDRLGLPLISTGDILREAKRRGTPVGLKAKGYMDRGELVPDEVILDLIRERLAEDDCSSGFILDGFPRTKPQAEGLEKLLEEKGWSISRVIDIALDDETIIDRLSSRLSCPECGRIYNLKSQPPAVEGKCDACRVDLYQRDDDRPETIRNRLSVYREMTRPVQEYYLGTGLLVRVDGGGTADDIAAGINVALESGPKPNG